MTTPPDSPFASEPVFANWAQRVASALIDGIIASAILLLGELARSTPLIALGVVFWIAFSIWNWARQGRTGQTIGKGVLGTKLVMQDTGVLVGVGVSIGRGFLHIIDSLPCYLGYLWPLWDPKRQTFADKVVRTVVVIA